ncbi:hypothetical protein DC31_13885 [Microbacterium sp. CH12i]|uniref:hypothetical protein n=1 Tax=Microbacterium sp. CH12i TaxID=1479651 RepID=UPI0004617C39|nr:hypothetical protein [Microbacterium sp. CH12i]KDA05559.1 hypothetical protein DC31_13885 [Microbacterium sp. CH12i]
MAAAPSAEQKAAADKAAAEKQAAEEKAKQEASEAASTEPEKEAEDAEPRFIVTGPVAVIRTPDGSERYLYRGAHVLPDAFDADSIKHVVSLGLVAEIK